MEANHKLRYLRTKQHRTQADLSRKLGVTRQYVSEIERGVVVPGRKLAVAIAAMTAEWGEEIPPLDWWTPELSE